MKREGKGRTWEGKVGKGKEERMEKKKGGRKRKRTEKARKVRAGKGRGKAEKGSDTNKIRHTKKCSFHTQVYFTNALDIQDQARSKAGAKIINLHSHVFGRDATTTAISRMGTNR